MATFDYTVKGWDKIRPKLLPSTGLGKALKSYEQVKAYDSAADCTDKCMMKLKWLTIVERAREEAIKACGSSKMFKDAKSALEAAKPEVERKLATAILANHIINLVSLFEKTAGAEIEIMKESIKLLDKAYKIYAKKGLPDKELIKYVETEIGGDSGVGLKQFTGQAEFKAFIQQKSVLKRDLSELYPKCEKAWEAWDGYPKLRKEKETLIKELRKLVG